MSEKNYDLDAFQQKMNEWVSSQGLLFQLSNGSNGDWRIVLPKIFLRLGVLALIIVVGSWFAVLKYVESEVFLDQLTDEVATSFDAESTSIKSFRKDGGRAFIKKIEMTGGESSFFYDLNIESVRCKMPFLAGIVGAWNAERVTVVDPSIYLKAGADTDEEAQLAWNSLFKTFSEFQFADIDIRSGDLTWGYGESTKGEIVDSDIVIERIEEGRWLVEFSGGRISQGWIKDAELVSLKVVVDQANGISAKEGLVKFGGGAISFDFTVSVGKEPQVAGKLKANGLSIKSILASASESNYRVVTKQMDAIFDGEGVIGGSPNGSQGVTTSVDFRLSENSSLVLRTSLPLIQKFNDLDSSRSFGKVTMDVGRFTMQTKSNQVIISDISMIDDKFGQLTGSCVVRFPTVEEVAALLELDVDQVKQVKSSFNIGDIASSTDSTVKVDYDSALKTLSEDSEKPQDSPKRVGKKESSIQNIDIDLVKRTLGEKRVIGDFMLKLNAAAFSAKPKLIKEFETDPENNQVYYPFSIDDPIDEMTGEASKQLQRTIDGMNFIPDLNDQLPQ